MSIDPFSPEPAPRGLSLAALAAFALGLLSLVLTCATGLPAILVGILAIRRINFATPPLRGQRLAFAGIVLGIVGCVLSVVGLIAVFLIDAIDKSRRMECSDNLRQLGRAVELHHQDNDRTYPPGSYFVHGQFQPIEPPELRLSWLVTLLPYLDRPITETGADEPTEAPRQRTTPLGLGPLIQKFDAEQPWSASSNQDAVNTPVRIFVCPSHPGLNRNHKPAPTHYIGSAGLGEDAPTLTLDNPRAGFLGYNRILRRERPVQRGTSNTLLAGETTRDNGPWAACGPSTVRGLVAEDVPLIGVDRPLGGCHRGGVNLLMLDGRVMFFNDRANPDALTLLVPLQEPPP